MDCVKDKIGFAALYRSAINLLPMKVQRGEFCLRWVWISHTHPVVPVIHDLKHLF